MGNLTILLQAVVNLTVPKAEDAGKSNEDAIPNLEQPKTGEEIESGICLKICMQNFVDFIYGRYEKAANMAVEHEGRFQKAGPGFFMNMQETFVTGICCFVMARKTKNSKYKKVAKRALQKMSRWAKKDNPNVLHYEKLFQAELSCLNGKSDAAELHYQQALSLASRYGFIQDAAIINERSGDFFLNIRKSPEDALYKFEKACKLYEEWGCPAKAQMLREYCEVHKLSFIVLQSATNVSRWRTNRYHIKDGRDNQWVREASIGI